MAKARHKKQAPEPARAAPPYARSAAIVLAVLVFYWTPLTSADTSIPWDAVAVHYSSQKYFADRVMNGSLPFWIPYIFCGFPFLADLQVGAFYPLNWPFFLAGVTPRAIEMELALHALLACAGAFLLARMLLGSPAAALASAFLYGLSGFFAAHSSHVGIFQTAAWLPWILYGFLRSLEVPSLMPACLTGLAAGWMILAGHFQTALYVFCALALFAALEFRRPRIAIALGIIVVGGVLTAAIQLLPGAELVRDSIRANLDTSSDRVGTPLDVKIEATYGYNPLTLKRYSDYIAAAESNRAMLDNLSATRILNAGRSAVDPNASARPFVSFPGGGGTAEVISHDEQSYRIRYRATAESVLRVAVAWFPGWRAVAARVERRVAPVDGALIGITVPPGEGELELRFRSTYFAVGAAISALTALALLTLAFRI